MVKLSSFYSSFLRHSLIKGFQVRDVKGYRPCVAGWLGLSALESPRLLPGGRSLTCSNRPFESEDIHTHMHIHLLSYIQTYIIQRHIHTYTSTKSFVGIVDVHTYIHTYIHFKVLSIIRTYIHIHIALLV